MEGNEFIEIQNQGTALAHLARVRILIKGAQANSPVAYGFPSDNVLSPGDVFVIAKNARQFAEQFGFPPSFEARASGAGYEDTADVRNLPHDRGVSRFSWALANSGATVALIEYHGEVIDTVAYGHDPSGYLGLHGSFPSAADGQSIWRVIFGEKTSTRFEGDRNVNRIAPRPYLREWQLHKALWHGAAH